jgi:hypothetical protein
MYMTNGIGVCIEAETVPYVLNSITELRVYSAYLTGAIGKRNYNRNNLDYDDIFSYKNKH